MLIGIAGPKGVGKRTAANMLAEMLGGKVITAPRPQNTDDLLPFPELTGYFVDPHVLTARDADFVRKHGRMIFMHGRRDTIRGTLPGSHADCVPAGRDWLVSNSGTVADLADALADVVTAIRRLEDGKTPGV